MVVTGGRCCEGPVRSESYYIRSIVMSQFRGSVRIVRVFLVNEIHIRISGRRRNYFVASICFPPLLPVCEGAGEGGGTTKVVE